MKSRFGLRSPSAIMVMESVFMIGPFMVVLIVVPWSIFIHPIQMRLIVLTSFKDRFVPVYPNSCAIFIGLTIDDSIGCAHA